MSPCYCAHTPAQDSYTLTQTNMKKKKLTGLVLGLWMASFIGGLPVHAAAPGSVVINEVAWAGSADSSNDEWIELYNTTSSPIDLSGWTLEDDGTPLSSLSGTIPANGYFLIEDSETVVNPNTADMILGLSLANTGDSLVLKDDVAAAIDTVNSGGGAWFAGDSTSKASMERIDALASGDDPANWANSDGTGSSATASGGSLILGTPGMLNSVSTPPALLPSASMSVSNPTPHVGDTITVDVDIADVSDLFSYGFEIDYDPAALSYVSSAQGSFLSESGAVSTSFQSGLENGTAGTLLVAEARTIDPKTSVSGSGTLFTMTFDVIGGGSQPTDITFDLASFLADTNGDMTANYVNAQVTPQVATVDPVTNLVAAEGLDRYSIELSWDSVADTDGYMVYRKDPHANWVMIGQTAGISFIDSDAVVDGGNIVPFVNYEYQVIAVKSSVESAAVSVTGMETRGLKGDNDRSDRVDGRDLDNLARHFAETDGDSGFDPLVDTTYDGMIDGNDLIDLGANFALVYQL